MGEERRRPEKAGGQAGGSETRRCLNSLLRKRREEAQLLSLKFAAPLTLIAHRMGTKMSFSPVDE